MPLASTSFNDHAGIAMKDTIAMFVGRKGAGGGI